jgi:hypothetical protein
MRQMARYDSPATQSGSAWAPSLTGELTGNDADERQIGSLMAGVTEAQAA